MVKFILSLVLSLAVSAAATAQEHKHDEQKEDKKAPAGKATEPAKSDGTKCCEGMDKTGDMKAKMENMKAMKENMAEKMKRMEGMKMKDMKGDAKTGEPDKDDH